MEFNLQKFLTEHKLTKRSRLNEDDNTGGMMKTDAEQGEMNDEEMLGDEPEDTYYKDEFDDTGDSEKEPTTQDVKKSTSFSDVQKKQVELQDLETKKKDLLKKYTDGVLTTAQYKVAIGDIPAQIAKLKADINAALEPTSGEEEEEI